MAEYNYEKFHTDDYALNAFKAPTMGGKAPDFMVETVDGTPQQLLDFDGDFLVLELGSVTCPLFQSRRSHMRSLVAEHPQTSFAILYVREAHPGSICAKHETIDDKIKNAGALVKDGEGRKLLIDGLDGTVHKAYGSFPNSCFIINKNGCIVFYSDWNNPHATGRALASLKAGKPATGPGVFIPASPPEAIKTFKIAGKGSAKDFFRGLPTLIWANIIVRNLRMLFGLKQGVDPNTGC